MKVSYFVCIICSTMSSPDSDEPKPNMFLPSMLRKNGGKFGETLGNALMNKFQSPRKSSQPESVDNSEDAVDKKEEVVKPVTAPLNTSTPEDSSNMGTLDRIPRGEILSDVRAQRVRAPSTRPKSNVLVTEDLVAAEIPLDEESTPPSPPEVEEKKVPVSKTAFQMRSIANEIIRKQESTKNTTNTNTEVPEKKTSVNQSIYKKEATQPEPELIKRKFTLRNRSERPVSVGNFETFNKTLPESEKNEKTSKTTDEVNKAPEAKETPRRYGSRGLYHSKSTDVLSTISSSPPSSVSASATNDKQLLNKQEDHNKRIRHMKTSAVTLVKSVQNMEVELAIMKKQLSNLFAIVKEIEENEKK